MARQDMPLQEMTIIDLLNERANKNAGDLAFRYMANGDLDGPIREWTFSELYRQSVGVAQDLDEQGLAGSSVLLAFPPGLDFVKAFYGCLIAGVRAVPVPLPNPRSKNPLDKILGTARACGALTILTDQQFADMAAAMGTELPVHLQTVTDRTGSNWSGPATEMTKVAYLQFTSGSTGQPKGVSVTHANAVANMRVMGEMLRIKPDAPAMVWAPHYHDLCLVGHILGPVYHGFESTLMSPLDFLIKPVRWLRAMSHYKVVNTACPNFGYEYSVKRIKTEECEGLDLSHWLVAGNGGEPVHQETMEAFTKKFAPYGFRPQTFMPTYGMAESVLFVSGLKPLSEPPRVLSLSADELESHRVRVINAEEPGERVTSAVSCGRPGSGHSVIAVDPDSLVRVSASQVGELWVSGPSVPQGYWGFPQESADTFEGYLSDTNEGPYLRTGDLGFIHDGEVYLTGRLKDLIIIAGRNHYPSDIELTVQKSGAPVRPGSCVAISERVEGNEELVIVSEVDMRKLPENALSDDGSDSQSLGEFWAAAARAVRGAISKAHGLSVRSIVFVEAQSLEKTSSGKPRRRHYQQLYREGGLSILHESRAPGVSA
jgi:acyl-CoA synthetase (AMP-forming)/AMP-acid ligase II